jgi:hypothetical protein
MILAFEMTWTGTTHAPGNGATLQTMALAFPGQALRVHAEASHIAELRRNAGLARAGQVSFHPVPVSALHRERTHRVSWQRFRTEFGVLRRALAAAPAG